MTDSDEGGPRPIRVALSNDYELALLGLAQMLARHPDRVQVVDLTTLPRMPHRPDVILYDTFGRLPDGDEKLRRIVAENDAKVVVYSWDHYPEEAARRQGAAGYLSKSLGADDLVAAIVAIHEGAPVPASVGDGGGQGAAGEPQPQSTWPGEVFGLTQRESEMLSFITRGLTNEQIAQRAYLSVNTIKTYIRTAYRKIGVGSRAQAVAWGYRNGFDTTEDIGP